MHSVQEQQRKLTKTQLQSSPSITYPELLSILDSCQIASGANYGIGRIKGMLDFLASGSTFSILQFNNTAGSVRLISNAEELAGIIKAIDRLIDLKNDQDFQSYFL